MKTNAGFEFPDYDKIVQSISNGSFISKVLVKTPSRENRVQIKKALLELDLDKDKEVKRNVLGVFGFTDKDLDDVIATANRDNIT